MAPEQAKHKGKERVAAAELGKRARISDAEPRPHAEPFLRADQSMLGQLQMNIKSSYEMIVGALERLPMQIARAMPAAVKEAQEDAANARRDANLAPLLSLLDACRSCYDLGAVRGFSYNPTEHRVVCEDCFRWGGARSGALESHASGQRLCTLTIAGGGRTPGMWWWRRMC